MRDIVLVGNSAGGTVTILDGHTFAKVGNEINVIPDLQQRLAAMTIVERAAYEIVRQQAGGDRFADDLAVSPDGRTLYVSRANLDDTVAIDLATHRQLWRVKIDGFESNHLALSPDGSRLLVSALTDKKVEIIDAGTGTVTGSIPTGDYPHANDYSPDGTHLYNSSIGNINLPYALDILKGQRVLTVVNAQTFQVEKTLSLGNKGIRPAAFTADNTLMYAQLSYLNGFVEYDLDHQRITRTVNLPLSAEAQAMSYDDYPLNSAHHGLALSGDETKLCDAGTISDYVAIVSRPGLTTDRIIPVGDEPYWATTSQDGQYCLVSNSMSDNVSVISYDQAQEVARIPVGDFPQRIRLASVPASVLG